ncbi:uncharacterized protein LOC106074928 isoform X3 [Biomphalaria glabrata]|uniref:Uncharacterized protein LOC106074928 isoform X3 n=1 Tax=Biomphalaria glabrata TaxID=6526 RepID=A0A9W3BKU1_BIOGL|nr:uncharacterized protein LOC106074928 isoform X3 [Biomphalaria glabrata]
MKELSLQSATLFLCAQVVSLTQVTSKSSKSTLILVSPSEELTVSLKTRHIPPTYNALDINLTVGIDIICAYNIPYNNMCENGRWITFDLMAIDIFSVTVFTMYDQTSYATFIALPLTSWGREYYVYTLDRTASMVIIAGLKPVSVTVTFRLTSTDTNFEYNGTNYSDNSEMVISLARLEGFELSFCLHPESVINLRGTKLNATWPVGVVSGSCRTNYKSPSCSVPRDTAEASFEMILPVEMFGTEHIVPIVPDRTSKGQVLIKATKKTSISVKTVSMERQTNEIEDFERIVTLESITQLNSTDGPVQVYFAQYSQCNTEQFGGVALSVVVPNNLFFCKYLFVIFTSRNARSYVIVVTPKLPEGRIKIKMDHGVTPDINWLDSYNDFDQGHISVRSGIHEIRSEGDQTFGCYIYGEGFGVEKSFAFMHPAGIAYSSKQCTMTLSTMRNNDEQDNDCDGFSEEEYYDFEDNDFDGLIDEDVATKVAGSHCAGEGFCDHEEEVCFAGCLPGYQGPCCSLLNNFCLNNDTCNPANESCPNGCQDGYYGSCCLQVKNFCLNNDTCNPVNGSCPNGCQDGYYGSCCLLECPGNCESTCNVVNGSCDKCRENYYGEYCNQSCSPGCLEDTCNKQDGSCTCKEGFYGAMCFQMKSFCRNKETCNPFNRSCPHGCQDGYYGGCCLQLKNFCLNNETCNPANRSCPNGCKDGYYGSCCLKECPGNCESICNVINGTCENCREKFYGTNCKKRCSPGCLGDTCNQWNGRCDCKEGFYGEMCLKKGLPFKEGWTCHCADGNCSENDGSCLTTDRCHNGWFAFSCQYIDIAPEADLGDMDSVRLLTDNDDSTCVNVTNNTIQATWSYLVPVTWFRLVFELKANVEDFDIKYFEKNATYLCLHPNIIYPTEWNNTIDIECEKDLHLQIQTLVVSWQGDGLCCSFHVSGSRNLAHNNVWKKVLRNYKTISKVEKVEAATDGNYETCVSVSSYQVLELTFSSSIHVNMISLYTDFKLPPRITNFKVRTWLGGKMLPLNMTSSMDDLYVSSFALDDILILRFLQISVIGGSQSLCEVEIIGDCDNPKIGFECEYFCSLTCVDQSCNYIGMCYECVEERYGKYCEEEMSTNSTETEYIENNETLFPSTTDRETDKTTNFSFLLLMVVIATLTVLYNVCFVKRKDSYPDGE